MASELAEHILDNPFFVLGLGPDCSRVEVERAGQKLLGMLELSLKEAATYSTPLGPVARTPEKVRQAMAELRDPVRRLAHETWARQPAAVSAPVAVAPAPPPAPWSAAWAALGWGRR